MPRVLLLIPLLLLVTGCPEEEGPGPDDDDAGDDDAADDDAADPCTAAWQLSPGSVQAMIVDGPSFGASNGTYETLGGLAITASHGDFMLTMSANFDENGESVTDQVEADQFPVSIALGQNGADTGYAMVYEGGTTFRTDDDHDGWLHLSGLDDENLVGCFSFTSASVVDGVELKWTAGLMYVPRVQ